MKTCSIDGCDGKHYGKNYCRRHYDKLRNHGDPLAGWDSNEEHTNPEICTFEDCPNKAFARAYCQKHYARLRNHGTLAVLERGSCAVQGCTTVYYGNNFCKPHYSKWYRHGDPLYIRTPAPVRKDKNKAGYVILNNVWDHPNAGKNGRIFEHQFVMSEYLGRPLLPHENVHHLNGQRDDNRIENLELWSKSQPAGQRVEDKTQWAVEWLKQYAPELLKEV